MMSIATQPFATAELEYRRQRVTEQLAHASHTGQGPRGRRHWVPRRPSLTLPTGRRRPVAVA